MAKGKKTGGRQAGTPNKATAEIKALAQVHGAAAVAELARISLKSKSDNARVAAIRELLDRAYGKAPQTLPEGAAGILAHLIIEDGYGQKRE